MKTKYSEIVENKEYNVCPICGETKSFYFDKDDNMKGVADGIYESWNSGFLWRKTMRKRISINAIHMVMNGHLNHMKSIVNKYKVLYT